ncbi:MAG: T9SS type A sorting domain-containing protein [Bacteroidetes bacterium]|nr:T9SS type A sorting domain-containing protein [Bacteroidota bacterium]
MMSLKSSYFLLLAFGFSSSLNAQNFVSFPDSNATWVNAYSTLNTSVMPFRYELAQTVKYCLKSEDTLIQNQSYQKIYLCDLNQEVYFGALRHDSDRVYIIPADSLFELKLYDFSLQPGDTIKDAYSLSFGSYLAQHSPVFEPLENSFFSLIVVQVDTLYSSLGAHRLIDFGQSGRWLEGIGNTQGLFWDPFPNISNFSIQLMCMSYGDSSYFNGDLYQFEQGAIAGPCDLSLNLQFDALVETRPFPNPSPGLLQLNNTEPTELILFNSFAEQVWQQPIGERARLDLSFLRAGVYYLHLNGKTYVWLKQ